MCYFVYIQDERPADKPHLLDREYKQHNIHGKYMTTATSNDNANDNNGLFYLGLQSRNPVVKKNAPAGTLLCNHPHTHTHTHTQMKPNRIEMMRRGYSINEN